MHKIKKITIYKVEEKATLNFDATIYSFSPKLYKSAYKLKSFHLNRIRSQMLSEIRKCIKLSSLQNMK